MSSAPSSGTASQQPLRISSGARSPPITSTAARTARLRSRHARVNRAVHQARARLRLVRLDLQGELGVDVAAVVAGGVRQLGAAALGAAYVMNRLEGQVGAALALAGLTVFLDGKHDELLGFARRGRRCRQ